MGVGVGVGAGRGELTGVCALRRMAVGFYCLGILDLYGLVDDKVSPTDSEGWRAWIWAQQASASPPPFLFLFLILRARDLTSAATITAPAAVRSGRARVRVPPRPARDD